MPSTHTIEANKPAVVTVTVRIQDPAFNAYRVDLVRVDAQAAVLSDTEMTDEDGTNTDAVAGHRFSLRMRDDGTKGDAVASDGVFTRRVVLKESSGPVYFEVRASFAKVERPIRSAPFAVNVSRQSTAPMSLLAIAGIWERATWAARIRAARGCDSGRCLRHSKRDRNECLVDQNSASWNQVRAWLSRLDGIRRAA